MSKLNCFFNFYQQFHGSHVGSFHSPHRRAKLIPRPIQQGREGREGEMKGREGEGLAMSNRFLIRRAVQLVRYIILSVCSLSRKEKRKKKKKKKCPRGMRDGGGGGGEGM